MPAGAVTATTADLDHDGAADELWLADAGGASGSGDDLALCGRLVVGGDVEGDLPLVERTRTELSDGGRQARDGATHRPAEPAGIDPEGPQVAAARQVRCGDQAPDTAVAEPS